MPFPRIGRLGDPTSMVNHFLREAVDFDFIGRHELESACVDTNNWPSR